MEYSTYFSAMQFLQLDKEIHQIRLVDGDLLKGKHALLHAPDEPALYGFEDIAPHSELLVKLLKSSYPDEQLTFLEKNGPSWQASKFTGNESGEFLKDKGKGFLYFPVINDNSSLIAFRELVAHLRAPEGCPWDRKQTHESLKSDLLEETYEVLDAIDGGVPADLCEG
jgi:tetrapyrrole methylase family protein/MazG family protein